MKFGWIAGRDGQNGLSKVRAGQNCMELRSSDFGQDRTEKNMRQGKEVVCDSTKRLWLPLGICENWLRQST